MKGDYSRITFDSKKHYSSVRMQQGRVQLDSDWNEAEDIRLHHERTIALDAFGPAGGPDENAGFRLTYSREKDDLIIGAGRYYLDGILCENNNEIFYSEQLHSPARLKDLPSGRYIAYLDVWESAVMAVDDPDIREVALDGPDTATRYKVNWQLNLEPETVERQQRLQFQEGGADFKGLRPGLRSFAGKISPGRMAAKIERGRTVGDDSGPCSPSINDRYGYLGNNLYRVEIHEAGKQGHAKFKWSRDNAGIIRAIESIDKRVVTIRDPARNCAKIFHPGQYVEITNDRFEAKEECGEFARIEAIDGLRLTLSKEVSSQLLESNPKLLLWDAEPRSTGRTEGWMNFAIKGEASVLLLPEGNARQDIFAPGRDVELSSDYLAGQGRTIIAKIESVTSFAEGKSLNFIDKTVLDEENFPSGSNPKIRLWDSEDDWIDLEMDIKISFPKGDEYHKGDYWLIASREISGRLIWPNDSDGRALFLPRQGAMHHLEKIAEIERNDEGWSCIDRRHIFLGLGESLCLDYVGGDGQQARPGELLPGPLLAAVTSSGFAVGGREVFFRIEKGEGRLMASPGKGDGAGERRDRGGAEEAGRAEESGETGKVGGASEREEPGSEEETSNDAREVIVSTDELGIARCYCRIDSLQVVVSACLAATEDDAEKEGGYASGQVVPVLSYRACCLSADEVGYSLPSEHVSSEKSINVKEALDRLYLAPQGSQCAVSVGEGGRYEKLAEALQSLIWQGKREISLCLLPGAHFLEKSLLLTVAGMGHSNGRMPGEEKGGPVEIIEAPEGTGLSIKGSGAGSKISLDGGKRIVLEGLKSLSMEGLEIEGEGPEGGLVSLQGIDCISLKRCIIKADGGGGLLSGHAGAKDSAEGIALSIKNGEGFLTLQDSQIEGVLCLYEGSRAGEFNIEEDDTENLKRRAGLLLGKVRRGTLTISHNQIRRISVGDRMASLIKKQLIEKHEGKPADVKADPALAGAKLEDIFQVMIVSGNVISSGPNHLIAGNLIVSGNYFDRQTENLLTEASPRMNWAIASKTVFTGNIGEEAKFSCAADPFEQSANLLEFMEL